MEVITMYDNVKREVLRVKTDTEKIDDLFVLFKDKHLLKVNRKYQRKLVWTVQEKKDFIDSLLNGYPVPLFLFAKKTNKDNDVAEREIVDGLQRLDAIFSFIQNEFPVMWNGREQYCNIQSFFCREEEIVQKKPVMDYDFCRKFGRRDLPTTTITIENEKVIEKIFKRLNSTGRELSKQDLRQAGAVGEFSDIVRKTAAEIRGDKSNADILDLSEMHEISINNEELNYGVKMNKLFWIKHDIITPADIRKSRDEELLAQIYCYALGGRNSGANSSVLDSLYDSSNTTYAKFEEKIAEQGQLFWIDNFMNIFNSLERIFKANHTTFSKLLFNKREVRGKNKIFLSLFLAIWDLAKKGRILTDPIKTKDALYHICTNRSNLSKTEQKMFNDIMQGNRWNKELRNDLIDFFKEKLITVSTEISLGSRFSKVEQDLAIALNETSKVKCENVSLEFKLGLHTLETGDFNKGVIRDIVKIYTAMNNLKLAVPSYVVLGIADNAESAVSFSQVYHSNFIGYGGCFVTGLDSEIKKYYSGQTDNLMRKVIEDVEKCPVDSLIKKRITNSLEFREYCGRLVLMLKVEWSGVLYKYDNKF